MSLSNFISNTENSITFYKTSANSFQLLMEQPAQKTSILFPDPGSDTATVQYTGGGGGNTFEDVILTNDVQQINFRPISGNFPPLTLTAGFDTTISTNYRLPPPLNAITPLAGQFLPNTFSNVTYDNLARQLIFEYGGVGNKCYFTIPQPTSGNRTITFPDAGIDAEVAYQQTSNIFSNIHLTDSSSPDIIMLNNSNQIQALGLSHNSIFNIPINASNNTIYSLPLSLNPNETIVVENSNVNFNTVGINNLTVNTSLSLPNLSVNIANINASGIPSNTTYLRGDGSWQPVSGGGNTFPNINLNNTSAQINFGVNPHVSVLNVNTPSVAFRNYTLIDPIFDSNIGLTSNANPIFNSGRLTTLSVADSAPVIGHFTFSSPNYKAIYTQIGNMYHVGVSFWTSHITTGASNQVSFVLSGLPNVPTGVNQMPMTVLYGTSEQLVGGICSITGVGNVTILLEFANALVNNLDAITLMFDYDSIYP